MRILLFIIAVVCFSPDFTGQQIFTKDMVLLGTFDEVYEALYGEGEQKYIYMNERIINKHFFCKCLIAELIPNIRFEVLNEAIENNKLDELLLQKKYNKVMDPCMKHYAKIEKAYSFDQGETTENEKQLYIEMCVESINSESFPSVTIPLQTIIDYCACAVNTMINDAYSLNQILEIDEEDSEAFNEILVPCITDVMGHIVNPDLKSGYSPEDIHGDVAISYTKLIDYIGYGYKVKISFGGTSKYYLFDTGASYLAIDSETEQALFSAGSITFESYKGFKQIMIADNTMIEAKIVVINSVGIGDYVIDNVTAVVIDGGMLLCGNSLLNKFKKWEIDTEEKQLILYK